MLVSVSVWSVVEAVELALVLLRPLDGTEVPLAFAPRGTGRWSAQALPPQRGQWEARLTLFGPNEAAFDIRRRFDVP